MVNDDGTRSVIQMSVTDGDRLVGSFSWDQWAVRIYADGEVVIAYGPFDDDAEIDETDLPENAKRIIALQWLREQVGKL